MKKQSFIYGTILLIIAGMITRLLGFINRIVIARFMGEEGVGLYMMALPSLFLLLTLTQIGLPTALAKKVAEANVHNDYEKIKRMITFSFFIISCTSLFFTICFIILVPVLAQSFFTDERTLFPLLAIAPTIPIIGYAAIMKGYFQGMQNMKPQSIAIVLEQCARIIAAILLIYFLLPYGIEFAATGAVLSICIGEIVSCLYLGYVFKRNKVMPVRKSFFAFMNHWKQTSNHLFSIALPQTGSKLISASSSFLEPIIVVQSLAIAGIASVEATKQYGELTGYALPLLFLPTFITNSLSIALLPSISEAEATKNNTLVHFRIHQAIRISFASGALATIIFTLFSESILTYMYGSSNASKYIILMAPFFLFLYIQAPLQAALIALNLAKAAMWNSFIGTSIKLILLILLATNVHFGMMGVAIAISVNIILVTFLHLIVLKKVIRYSLSPYQLLNMCVLVTVTYIAGHFLKKVFMPEQTFLPTLIILLTILTVIYGCLVFLLRFITKEELNKIWFQYIWKKRR